VATSSRLRRPLRVYAEAEGERHATWLELFFDLVMVVAVAELAHVLHDDLSLAGAATYVGLFVPVWLALAVSELEWTPAATAAAALSFITVAGLWWLYFDHVDEGAITRGAAAASFGDLWPSYVHGYGHLVIFAALGAVGVGAEYAVEHADDDHLGLGGRLALLAGIGAFLLVATAQQRVSAEPIGSRLVVGRLAGAAACALLVPLGALLAPVVLTAAVTAMLVALVALDVSETR